MKGFKYRLCLWKGYFEKGNGLMQYPTRLLTLGAIGGTFLKLLSLSTFAILGVAYAIALFYLGWGWYHYGWIYAENEVSNRFNLFVKEMRRHVKAK